MSITAVELLDYISGTSTVDSQRMLESTIANSDADIAELFDKTLNDEPHTSEIADRLLPLYLWFGLIHAAPTIAEIANTASKLEILKTLRDSYQEFKQPASSSSVFTDLLASRRGTATPNQEARVNSALDDQSSDLRVALRQIQSMADIGPQDRVADPMKGTFVATAVAPPSAPDSSTRAVVDALRKSPNNSLLAGGPIGWIARLLLIPSDIAKARTEKDQDTH